MAALSIRKGKGQGSKSRSSRWLHGPEACSLPRWARLLGPQQGPICCPKDQRLNKSSFSVPNIQQEAFYFWLVSAKRSERRVRSGMFWVVQQDTKDGPESLRLSVKTELWCTMLKTRA